MGDNRRRFTEAEDAIIRELWERGATGAELMAALPGRSHGVISNRAMTLGLKPITSVRFEMQHGRAQ